MKIGRRVRNQTSAIEPRVTELTSHRSGLCVTESEGCESEGITPGEGSAAPTVLPSPPHRGRHSAGHSFPMAPRSPRRHFRLPNPTRGGLAPRQETQLRAGTARNQTVLHILCSLLLISTDKLGHLVPPSWGRGDMTEMALHHGGRGRRG